MFRARCSRRWCRSKANSPRRRRALCAAAVNSSTLQPVGVLRTVHVACRRRRQSPGHGAHHPGGRGGGRVRAAARGAGRPHFHDDFAGREPRRHRRAEGALRSRRAASDAVLDLDQRRGDRRLRHLDHAPSLCDRCSGVAAAGDAGTCGAGARRRGRPRRRCCDCRHADAAHRRRDGDRRAQQHHARRAGLHLGARAGAVVRGRVADPAA